MRILLKLEFAGFVKEIFSKKKYVNQIVSVLFVSVFFTSCFGYRTVNLAEKRIKLNKIHKVITKDQQAQTGLISEVTDSTITLSSNDIKSEIPRSDIREIKQKKFSVLGSVAMTAVVYIGVGAIAFFAWLIS